jgi:transketolase
MTELEERQFDPVVVRRRILEMAHSGSTVHIACAFSLVEILCVLYEDFVNYPHNDPDSPERDFLVLSKGHGVMAQYACMYEKGWVTQSQIDSYFSDGTDLKGLSDSRVPGLEVTSGSLGHGLSVGVGLALGAQRRGSEKRTIVIIGDGEANEGPIWEGALLAAQHKLKNFLVIVDYNRMQAMGTTDDIMSMDPFEDKFTSFGFEARTVNGHDIAQLREHIRALLDSDDPRPKALVANTIKGRGVSFMENNNAWHYTRLTDETYAAALAELAETS